MSSREGERRARGPGAPSPQAGFMLLEVLVAIVIAGLVLGVIGRALADGWRSTRIPLDVLSAASLASAGLQHGPQWEPGDVPHGYAVTRRIGTAVLIPRTTPVAPAPLETTPSRGPSPRGPRANDVMPGVTVLPPGPGSTGTLQTVAITVRTPTGRRVTIETVRLDAPAT